MSGDNAERLLRGAVRDLAGDPHQTPDLATVAVSRGRRIRRRRQVGTVAAAFVAVAAIAAPYVLLRPDPGPPGYPIAGQPATSATAASATTGTAGPAPTAAPEPTIWRDWESSPVKVPGGWIVTGATTTGTPVSNWAYDRTRGRYVDTSQDYSSVWTAPQGRLAAVRKTSRPGETGLLDIPTGKVRWIRTTSEILTPQWSPDGTRLLMTLMEGGTGDFSFGVLTVANSSFRRHAVRPDRFECTDLCRFTWVPSGKEVALPMTDPAAPRSESAPHLRRGLQLFSAADGTPTRLLPVRGNVSGPSAWSPDGRLMVVAGQETTQLVSVDKGTVMHEMPSADVTWIDEKRLLYLDRKLNPGSSIDVAAVLVDLKGTEIARTVLPAELAGTDVLIARR
ncbi:TolB-like translocation protein [Plantactinospora soyae]|uniref:WD40 repeat domain-containing protein n=1 Tax=Plantactinospora soyae TaxID=1544732 RepID=A0A927R5N6_9ACTN|nr:PD40 domain-containing protein [Plantactinospora soyae]MBE1486091.1 hypothetical protein [Plantactinospora soyae]